MMNRHTLDEHKLNIHAVNTKASVYTLGNGYLGIRGTYEEEYVAQTRGLYVAGVYNKAHKEDPSDLVNIPDVIGMSIQLNDQFFSMMNGEVNEYSRSLNFTTGELSRCVIWTCPQGKRYQLRFQRFVSKASLHTIGAKLSIVSIDQDSHLKLVTGIDAQQTNFGRQHLREESVRVFDEQYIQGIYRTTQTDIGITISSSLTISHESNVSFHSKNRQLMYHADVLLPKGQEVVIEKITTVHTTMDQQGAASEHCLSYLHTQSKQGYRALYEETSEQWQQFWHKQRIHLESTNPFDQTAIQFAQYHMEIMTPKHDHRFSLGAKGLTGEGYKGHVFWDTEIFLLPAHLYTQPYIAKQLLQYRYLHLSQAMEKAQQNGYKGALFPWESALSGEEETPEYAAINIRTGTRQKVASALAEHHIVADIAFAVVQYYEATYDDAFMRKEGIALLRETAKFWMSRAIWRHNRLEILDVIGPDEYTEHIDNNAFTNYMAHYNVEQAIKYLEKYENSDESFAKSAAHFLEHLYLPTPNKEHIIPQDDTFLAKREIDLSKYKKSQGSQAILLDYSRAEVNEMQILKQADVVMLLYLFPKLFPREVIERNLYYYEQHTIHDSSLSKAIHSIVAARCDETAAAYQFFQEACLIDLGDNPHSSDEGIHAASLGAIWLAVVFGFANIAIHEEYISLEPKIPQQWKKLMFELTIHGTAIQFQFEEKYCQLTKMDGPDIEVMWQEKRYTLQEQLTFSWE